MKKNLLIILLIIVVLIIILLSGIVVINKQKRPGFVSNDLRISQTQDTINNQRDGFTGKLKQALLKNIPLKCSWKKDETFSAVGYLKGKSYYGEVIRDGKKSYLIIKNNCMWTWYENNKQGAKMCFKGDVWDQQNNIPQEDYHCAQASVSDDMFIPPADISFLDIDKQMGGEEE